MQVDEISVMLPFQVEDTYTSLLAVQPDKGNYQEHVEWLLISRLEPDYNGHIYPMKERSHE
jgi:hypothetical protein